MTHRSAPSSNYSNRIFYWCCMLNFPRPVINIFSYTTYNVSTCVINSIHIKNIFDMSYKFKTISSNLRRLVVVLSLRTYFILLSLKFVKSYYLIFVPRYVTLLVILLCYLIFIEVTTAFVCFLFSFFLLSFLNCRESMHEVNSVTMVRQIILVVFLEVIQPVTTVACIQRRRCEQSVFFFFFLQNTLYDHYL